MNDFPELGRGLKPWDGGRAQQKTRAWRGLCQLSSIFFVPHLESDIPRLRAGETQVGSELCLSSSLHNQIITF